MKKYIAVLILCLLSVFCLTAVACGDVEFSINFVVDESIYATVSTGGGETIKMPENPKKDGYDFDGWFWDEDTWELPFTANSLLNAPLSSDMSVYARFTKQHEHNYTAVITAPTCTERGYTTYSCDCGDSYIDDYVDELGHIPNTAVEENRQEPQCEVKGGYDLVVYCKTCGAELSREHKEIAALTHEFTNYVSDNNATYDSDGTKTAHCNHGCGATHTITDVGTKLKSGIAFKTLAVDGNNVYGKIPNAQTEFDFLTEIEKKGNVTYDVSRSLAGDDIIVSKTAEPNEGDNKYYILVYQNGDLLSKYNVTIRRREIYTVSFNTDGGTVVAPQIIEEDSFATEPTTERAGYTFTGWDYIFENSITENTVITASWTANTDTKYKVEYYLQNLADDNYTLEFTDNLTGETDKQATAEIKTYNHFTYNESKSIVSGNINGDETTVLKVYYTRDIYGFSVTNENTKGGTINCTDNGSYRFGKQINLVATVNDGYDFVGWFNGDIQISAELKYSFTLTEKTDITAKYSVHTNTKYTVETYLENLDGTYTKQSTEEKFGETDSTATVTPTAPEHYSFDESKSIVSGNINGDNGLVLRVYYIRNFYTVIIETSHSCVSLNATISTKLKYGTVIPDITATFNNYLGYEWQGWYSNGELMTYNDTIQSFTVDKDINYVATCKIKPEMANFSFNSTTTTCTITGIKNKTVTEIIVPDYVTAINQGAFSGCSSVTKVNYTGTIDKWCEISFSSSSANPLYYDKNLYINNELVTSANITTATKINAFAFYNCSSLTSITIGGSVTSIGNGAFYGCSSLTSITIPDSVTSIGNYAFYGCRNLSSITIPDSVTIIGDYAFYNCSSLTNITIPDSVTSIRNYAFYNCNSLTSITIPDGVTNIGESAFSGCSCLQEMTIPFVGGSIKTASDTNQYPFGYIFGESSYTGGAGITQYYYGSSTSSKTSTTYYIPTSLKSVTVTGGNILYGAFYNCSNLTSVTIGSSVTSIEYYAFYGCSSLTNITIGNSVRNIGEYAFYNCSGLTSITIPNSVTSIGRSVFFGCSSLQELTIPFVGGSVKTASKTYQYPFGYIFGTSSYTGGIATTQYYYGSSTSSNTSTTYYIPTTLKSVTVTGGNILYGAFYGCSSLTSITIPDSVTSIGSSAFYYCSGLTSITIPDSVTSIGSSAFYYCSGLTSITIPYSVTSIGRDAFSGCSGLTSITIPYSVTSIGNNAFLGCSSLTSITIGGSVTSIGNGAFYGCSSLTSITIPDSVTSIGSSAFYGCRNLSSITIPDSVTSIGDHAFSGCRNLSSITIPNSVTSIANYAFRNCSSLTSITIPDSVTNIGNNAFYGCSSLTSITIPDSVTSIGEMAFSGCSVLTSVTIPDSVTNIGSSVFEDCSSLTNIIIPDSVTSIGDYTFSGCSSLQELTIPFVGGSIKTASDTYQYPFGYIFGTSSYTGGTATTQYYYGSSTSSNTSTTYYIPTSLKSVTVTGGNILCGAFYGCSSLTSITIPDSVTNIGNNAFYGCSSLTSITIPDSVTSIGEMAFSGCSVLTSVTIPDSVTNIGSSVFEDCSSLTNIIIPDSVTSIGSFAFSDCSSLTSIIIPDSVTSIGYVAFYGCSSLASVYYLGTAEDWNKISMGSYNSNLTTATRYYYSETEPTTDGNYWHYENGEIVVWAKEN